MPEPSQAIDPRAYAERLERISTLFASMIVTAGSQATWRCPYRNRHDHCTAHFGCRNQRWPDGRDAATFCGGDDKLDYRSAWETG